jgi:hypothetical protein
MKNLKHYEEKIKEITRLLLDLRGEMLDDREEALKRETEEAKMQKVDYEMPVVHTCGTFPPGPLYGPSALTPPDETVSVKKGTLPWAIAMLQEEKRVKRKTWDDCYLMATKGAILLEYLTGSKIPHRYSFDVFDFDTTDWQLVEEPHEQFTELKDKIKAMAAEHEKLVLKPGTFEWALAMMKQGKRVRRRGWCDGIYLKGSNLHIDKDIFPLPETLAVSDATDWQLYEEARP